ncbi:MAG TPA: hypothetical protein VKZ79_07550 [Alphaproteobacteria bacterium]|nr:hypothetical protein [Alphaproteobacteria bacterium]
MDPDLYASQVTYQHGDGSAHAIPRDAFLSRIDKEQRAFGAFASGDPPKLSSFTADPDAVIAMTEKKGRLPTGAPVDIFTSISFTVTNGLITAIKLSSSPELGPQFAEWFHAHAGGRGD